MLLKIVSFAYFLIRFQCVFGYNCVPDDRDFAKGCQTLVTTGYKYDHFYPIEKQPNGDVFLRLYVKAETDAHILFSNNNPQGSENLGRHYEIIIGAYGNFRSAIRTRKQGENIDPHEEHNILSSAKWREFWIRISSDGLIEVGKGTSRTTFLSWKDPNTFEINYYSLSCWAPDGTNDFKSQHTAYWIHQCSNENYNKYNSEKFKCDLLSNYDQRVPPVEAVHNQININSFYADWDISNGIFKLIGTAKMEWQDNRLAWDPPSEYYGITSLNITNHPIWRPDLKIANAAFDNNNPFGTGETTVSHAGWVSWTTPINLQTKCSDTGAKSESPDLYKCRINISTNTFGCNIHISDATPRKISSPCIINDADAAANVRKTDSKSTINSLSIDVPFKIKNGYNSTPSSSKCVVFSVPLLTMIIFLVLGKQLYHMNVLYN